MMFPDLSIATEKEFDGKREFSLKSLLTKISQSGILYEKKSLSRYRDADKMDHRRSARVRRGGCLSGEDCPGSVLPLSARLFL
jgi:hypothetical protein